MVAVGQRQAEEPVLDGREWDGTEHQTLFGLDGGSAADQGGQFGDRLALEELARGQGQAGLGGTRDDLDADDRVAAQREEVVVDANLREAEHLCPQLGQLRLDRRPWRHVGSFYLRPGHVRRR